MLTINRSITKTWQNHDGISKWLVWKIMLNIYTLSFSHCQLINFLFISMKLEAIRRELHVHTTPCTKLTDFWTHIFHNPYTHADGLTFLQSKTVPPICALDTLPSSNSRTSFEAISFLLNSIFTDPFLPTRSTQ